MTIELAERSIEAVKTLLQENFETELLALDDAHSDGLLLEIPPDDNYYTYAKPVVGGSVHVEIFEDSIELDELDLSRFQDHRATYQLDFFIRLTWFNRVGHTTDQMVTLGRRYSSALFNVLTKNEISDASVLALWVRTITSNWEIGEEASSQFKGQLVIGASTRCEEIQS